MVGMILCSVTFDGEYVEYPFVFKNQQLFDDHDGSFFDDLIEAFPVGIDENPEPVNSFDPRAGIPDNAIYIDY